MKRLRDYICLKVNMHKLLLIQQWLPFGMIYPQIILYRILSIFIMRPIVTQHCFQYLFLLLIKKQITLQRNWVFMGT